MNWPLSFSRRVFLLLSGGLLAKLGLVRCEAKEAEQQFSAAEILQKTAETYKNCKSYQDTGNVVTVFHQAKKTRSSERPFSTAFVRPGRFRFEYKDSFDGIKWYRHIICANGNDVQRWWDIRPGLERPASLAMALAGATGVSGGSAHTIPTLLMPDEITGLRLTDLSELKRLDDGRVAKADCYRIQGQLVIPENPAERERHRREIQKIIGRPAESAKNGPTIVWIEKKSLLVRRIDQQTQFDSFRTESTTTYDPFINEPVPERKLEFDPPEK